MGAGENSNLLYIIDYGLAKKYRDPQTQMHIPYRDNKRLTGTARYASLCTHLGIEQSRRDDMECLAYTFIYLLKGQLPWQGIQGVSRHDKYNIIKEKKQNMKIEEICKDLPPQFGRYLYYCRSLKFEDKPDYAQLKKLFKDLFYEKQYDSNFSYDWVMLKALAGIDRVDSLSMDATNFADGPGRKCPKLVQDGSGLKVTEISTPKTIHPIAQPISSCRSASQPMTPPGENLRNRDKTVQFSTDNPGEDAKVSKGTDSLLKAQKSVELPPGEIATPELEKPQSKGTEREVFRAYRTLELEPERPPRGNDEELEKILAPRRPSTLGKIVSQPPPVSGFYVNPFESSSCDFKEKDIVEDAVSFGMISE